MTQTPPNTELEKVTLRLFKGDTRELEDLYPKLGYNAAIRTIVRAHIQKVKNEAANRMKNQQLPEGNVDEFRHLLDNTTA